MSKGSNLMKLRKKQRGTKKTKAYPMDWLNSLPPMLEDVNCALTQVSDTLERAVQKVVELCSTAQQNKMNSKMESTEDDQS